MASTIDFGDAWAWTTERLSPGLRAVFDEKLPGALPPGVSFDAAEMVADLAQRLQLLVDIGSPTCGVTSRIPSIRHADIYFSCQDFTVGSQSISLALQIVDRLTEPNQTPERFATLLQSCIEKIKQVGLQPATLDMAQAATRRGIPWVRLSPLLRHVQLGHGHRQRRLWTTAFSAESALAQDYSTNKILTLDTLSQIRLPVGRYAIVKDIAAARKSAQEIGYPVVLKPVDGKKGQSVFVDLRNDAELTAAARVARLHDRQYMLQSFFPGDDHRLLVVAGKLVAAARRDPASVTGDGSHTIAQLIEVENRDPRRVSGRVMEPIELDERSDAILARQGLSRGSIAETGRVVRVQGVANVSAGGTAADVMDVIHQDNARAATRAAKAIGLNVCGVDFISPDISKSWHDVGGGICEVNASVGLRPHLQTDLPIDVRDVLLQSLYPEGDDGRIPTAILTGPTAMTSTSTMLASVLSSAGHVVGCATTEGVRIGGELVVRGDLASAEGASIVLRDATVTAAVLEATSDGIAETGLYVDRCDVAALLNDSIHLTARKVLDIARKAVVLNADNPGSHALAEEFVPRIRTILFSKRPDSAAIRNHLAAGGDALFLADRGEHTTIVVASGLDESGLLATNDIPAPKEGLSSSLAVNAMAAAALAIGFEIDLDDIREGLRRYGRECLAASLCGKGEVSRAQA